MTLRRLGFLAIVSTSLLLVACSGGQSAPSPSAATTPATLSTVSPPESPVPTQWVVTLGDSYISGEGARWAGNTDGSFTPVDALGDGAYVGDSGREAYPRCHRADQSEAQVDFGNVRGANLACSGAMTITTWSGGDFKPGLDFYHDAAGHQGQALALQTFAKHHHVTDVVVSIGGNDFGFGSVVAQCAATFVATVAGKHLYCKDNPDVAANFTAQHADQVAGEIAHALDRVATAMHHAGYAGRAYRLIVQNYPSPIPSGDGFRYPETRSQRLLVGGCPLFNADATWANQTVLTTMNTAVTRGAQRSGLGNISRLDMSRAFVGHRLCEKGVGQLQETGLSSWHVPGASHALEWVNMAYFKPGPWQLQESDHPNYWGTGAERDCLRQIVRSDTPTGSCVIAGPGLDPWGEPMMRLE